MSERKPAGELQKPGVPSWTGELSGLPVLPLISLENLPYSELIQNPRDPFKGRLKQTPTEHLESPLGQP